MSPARRPETWIVGAGRLARALVAGLVDAAWPVRAVVVRRAAAGRRMRALAPEVPCVRAAAPGRTAVVLLAVPDRAIAPVAASLAAAHPDFAGIAVHFSGVLGPEAAGALAGPERAAVLHPLQSLGPAGPGVLVGSRARIEGGAAAVRVARSLARALGLRPVRPTRALSPDDRATYHAAAALAANDVVALLAIATDRLEQAGLRRADALDGVLSLARGVLANVARAGLADGLTGPVARGDAATLRRHLEVLRATSRDEATVHRVLSRRLLDLVEDRLEPEVAARLRRVVGGGRAPGEDV